MPVTPPINPDDPEKSIRRRVWYLAAISEYVHEFWERLRDDVLYSNQFFDYVASGQPLPEGMTESAQLCFDRWLLYWEVVDEWLMDACRQTLQGWAIEVHHEGRHAFDNRQPLPVWYGPNESSLAAALTAFTPIFDRPYPVPLKPLSPEDHSLLVAEPLAMRIYETTAERESGAEFKKRMESQFETQLSDYIARCEARILQHRNIGRDAAWTMLFQFGFTPKEIEGWEFNRSGEAFSHARIQQVVKEFANAMGLTLRKPKAGRNTKGKNT